MKNLIVANWKMNPSSQKEAKGIFSAIGGPASGWDDVDVVVCPPFVYLSELKGLMLGAQNVFFEDKGAFTGEISAEMLKDLGVEYVIVGHSERRKIFGETNEVINKKIKKSLEQGLKVIFCIGETAEEKTARKRNEVLETQIKNGLAEVVRDRIPTNLAIAYEPVWAIGTGNNCSVEESKDALEFIKNLLPAGTRVLYGGSVKSDNSADYLKTAGYNGLLVGGASLKADEFVKIIKSAE